MGGAAYEDHHRHGCFHFFDLPLTFCVFIIPVLKFKSCVGTGLFSYHLKDRRLNAKVAKRPWDPLVYPSLCPYIIRPTKKRNYWNILPNCLLIPLGTSSTFFEAVGVANKQRSSGTWALNPPIINESTQKSSHACVGSLLSTNSREEQVNNAPIKSQSDHDVTAHHLILPRYSFSIPIHLFRIIYMNK
jgi:hypothetical protein